MLNMSSNKKGFTLVELLLVISIISLLSSIVLTSTRGVRERAIIARKMQQAGPFHRMLGVGLVGEWRFDGNYHDTSGNGNSFTFNPGNTLFVDSFHPTFNRAVRIPTSNYLARHHTLASNPLNLGGRDVSIATWIRLDQNCNLFCYIFGFRLNFADEGGYYLARRQGTDFIFMKIGNYHSNNLGGRTRNLERGIWYFIVGTYNHKNKNLSIYVDAEKDVNQDLSALPSFIWTPSTSSQNHIYAGMYIGASLDDLRVYNEALTEAQVRKMYAEEISKKGLVSE